MLGAATVLSKNELAETLCFAFCLIKGEVALNSGLCSVTPKVALLALDRPPKATHSSGN
jgi:hypothetical protein